MSTMPEMPDKLWQAIAAIRARDRSAGRRLLLEVIQSEPRNEVAWLWMAGVAESEAGYVRCLETVLDINPNNKMAGQALAALLARSGNSPHISDNLSPAAGPDAQPLAQSSLKPPSPTSQTRNGTAGAIAGGVIGLIVGFLVCVGLLGVPPGLAYWRGSMVVAIISGAFALCGAFAGLMIGAGSARKLLAPITQNVEYIPAAIVGGVVGLALSLLVGVVLMWIFGQTVFFIAPAIAGGFFGYLVGGRTIDKIFLAIMGALLGTSSLGCGVGVFLIIAGVLLWLVGGMVVGAKVGVDLADWLAGEIKALIGR
jgi:hypothetical protein